MAQQRRQLEQLREELSLTTNQDLSTPVKGLSSTLCKASCMLLMGRGMLGSSCTCILLLEAWDVSEDCFGSLVCKPEV